MELKLRKYKLIPKEKCLLIVPYGIETEDPEPYLDPDGLLIVPYGIETSASQFLCLVLAIF